VVLPTATSLPRPPTGTPGIPDTWRQADSLLRSACRTPDNNFLQAPLHPLALSWFVITHSAHVHYCYIHICAKQLTKWCIMKRNRDVCQSGQNCQTGKTQWKGKKEEEPLASAMHGHKLNTERLPPFSFSLAYRQEVISVREGD